MTEGVDGSKSGRDKETDEARGTDGPSAGCCAISSFDGFINSCTSANRGKMQKKKKKNLLFLMFC